MADRQSKPKIFAFVNGPVGNGRDVIGAAVAEDDTVLPASHLSSGASWCRRDMGADGHCTWKHDVYAEHYPGGFEVEWVDNPLTHPVLSSILAKLNAEASPAAKTEA